MVEDDGCMFSRAVGVEFCSKCPFEDCCVDTFRERDIRKLIETTSCTEKEAVLIVLERDGIKQVY